MATAASTLVTRCRRFMGDYPPTDATTGSLTSNATTVSVADATIYTPNWLIQVDDEAMLVRAASGTTLTVTRGWLGSTAATHTSAATVYIRPRFANIEILDALNAAIDATFPYLYQPVIDESLTAVETTYEYTVPNLNSVPIPYLSRLSWKDINDTPFMDVKDWDVMRGTVPKIRLKRTLPSGTLRVSGFGPLPQLADLSASLSALFPVYAEDALVYYVAQHLLASGEARRVREDTGLRTDQEWSNKVGSSMTASNSLLQRFTLRLVGSAMPPMPKHVKSVV